MKKILLVFAAVALISLPFVMSSCEEDNPVSCSKLITDIAAAVGDCDDYKDALNEYIDSDCDTFDDEYQTIVDGLDC